jgi:hypothetical protein
MDVVEFKDYVGWALAAILASKSVVGKNLKA